MLGITIFFPLASHDYLDICQLRNVIEENAFLDSYTQIALQIKSGYYALLLE